MSYFDKYTTSLYGRRFGLQQMSSNLTGSGRSGEAPDFIVGAEDVRKVVSTAPTTSKNMPAYGVQNVPGTSAASSAVYTLDPPIPGVMVCLNFNSSANSPVYVKTANGETIISSQGTTMSVVKSTNAIAAGIVCLMGVSTSQFSAMAGYSTATIAFSTTT